MNKKKFFATCTLVAFGATMVPAVAFAVTPTAAAGAAGMLGKDGDGRTSNIIDLNCHVEDTWISENDTLEIVPVNADGSVGSALQGYFVTTGSPKTEVTAFSAGKDPDNSDDDIAGRAKFVLSKPLPVGTYQIVLRNTECNADATDEVKDKRAVADLVVEDPAPTMLSASAENAGKMVFTGTANDEKIYELGENYGWITDSTKAIGTASGTTYEVGAADLTAGYWYGVGTVGNAPTKVYKCDGNELKKANDAVTKIKEGLQKGLDTLPSEIVLDEANLNDVDLAAKIAAKITDKDFTAADLYILDIVGNGQLKDRVSVKKSADYTESSDVYTTTGTAVMTQGVAGGAEYLEGTVKVVAAKSGVSGAHSTIKTINVTIKKLQSLDKAVDAYGKEKFADYDESTNTATAILTKVGDGFDADKIKYASGEKTFVITSNTVKLGNETLVGDEVTKYFKGGKVVALPEKDITMNVVLTADSGAANIITVATTIKAGGAFDPTEKRDEEELKALTKEELAEVKEYADEQKATTLAARNAKAEAAAQSYIDQKLDLTVKADLDKATALYLSYAAERKAYKDAKAYAALVDSVVAK